MCTIASLYSSHTFCIITNKEKRCKCHVYIRISNKTYNLNIKECRITLFHQQDISSAINHIKMYNVKKKSEKEIICADFCADSKSMKKNFNIITVQHYPHLSLSPLTMGIIKKDSLKIHFSVFLHNVYTHNTLVCIWYIPEVYIRIMQTKKKNVDTFLILMMFCGLL